MLNAWIINLLLLFSAFALVFAVTNSIASGLLLVSPLYLAFGIATAAKIQFMHSAVQPLDLIRVPEFLPLIRSFFGAKVLLATVSAVAIWILALLSLRRYDSSRVPKQRRWLVGLSASILLLVVPTAFVVAPSHPATKALLVRLKLPGDDRHRETVRNYGLLLSFLSELPSVFVPAPRHYSREAVASTLGKYKFRPDTVLKRSRVNLIVYLVESLMDPEDLHWNYTSDPIPNLRALRRDHLSGYGIVPEEFGGSANTEFEVLTGMTRLFLPEGSLPYRQYLRRPMPGLTRTLRNLGYRTIAIQADPKYYYNRERVYDLLGFQHSVWLHDSSGISRAPRGWWPSDSAVVNAIIQVSQGPQPFFAFAFPSSTHSPYNVGLYKDSDLDLIGGVGSASGEVKEYVNAVRDADRAIGRLIDYFRDQPDSTIIAILGDHLPPLSAGALEAFSDSLLRMAEPERVQRLHRVPLMVWANFAFPQGKAELSTNALPSLLLEKMKIPPSGFLKISDAVRRRLPVLGRYVHGADGRIWKRDSVPDEERTLLEEYQLLQYDWLLGKQFARDNSFGADSSPVYHAYGQGHD